MREKRRSLSEGNNRGNIWMEAICRWTALPWARAQRAFFKIGSSLKSFETESAFWEWKRSHLSLTEVLFDAVYVMLRDVKNREHVRITSLVETKGCWKLPISRNKTTIHSGNVKLSGRRAFVFDYFVLFLVRYQNESKIMTRGSERSNRGRLLHNSLRY